MERRKEVIRRLRGERRGRRFLRFALGTGLTAVAFVIALALAVKWWGLPGSVAEVLMLLSLAGLAGTAVGSRVTRARWSSLASLALAVAVIAGTLGPALLAGEPVRWWPEARGGLPGENMWVAYFADFGYSYPDDTDNSIPIENVTLLWPKLVPYRIGAEDPGRGARLEFT